MQSPGLQKSTVSELTFRNCTRACRAGHRCSGHVYTAPWQEAFPAKLSQNKTLALKQEFLRKYRSELLDDSTILAFKQAACKQWRFIPWKWRLSVAELEEMCIQMPSKLPRMELADLLLDNVPSNEILWYPKFPQ